LTAKNGRPGGAGTPPGAGALNNFDTRLRHQIARERWHLMEPPGTVGVEMVAPSTMLRVAWLAVAGASLLIAGSALAQTPAPPQDDQAADTQAYDPAEQPDFSVLNEPTPDVRMRGALGPPRAPSRPDPIGSRSEKPDGSVSVSAGQRLPIDWETKVGVDIAAPGSTPDAFAGRTQERGAGWANVAVPAAPLGLDKATIDARVDPDSDQGKLSTALSRSVPISDGVSVTLQNGYAVTQSLANPGGVGTHVYSGDGGVRLELPSATALSAGQGCPRPMNACCPR
jgi:hypothetical protein